MSTPRRGAVDNRPPRRPASKIAVRQRLPRPTRAQNRSADYFSDAVAIASSQVNKAMRLIAQDNAGHEHGHQAGRGSPASTARARPSCAGCGTYGQTQAQVHRPSAQSGTSGIQRRPRAQLGRVSAAGVHLYSRVASRSRSQPHRARSYPARSPVSGRRGSRHSPCACRTGTVRSGSDPRLRTETSHNYPKNCFSSKAAITRTSGV